MQCDTSRTKVWERPNLVRNAMEKTYKDRWKKRMIENHMPPLKMGKASYQLTIRALGHSNELGPNGLSKTPIRLEFKIVS